MVELGRDARRVRRVQGELGRPSAQQLRALLDEDAYDAARRTTINAHYTDPAYVRRSLGRAHAGSASTAGDVLEPGGGAGTFIGMAPAGARMIGVELDRTTAAIARGLYPHADDPHGELRGHQAARAGHFDAVVGNVPFATSPCTTRRTTAAGTRSTTTSSSSRWHSPGPAAWSPCSRAATRWTRRTPPRAAR